VFIICDLHVFTDGSKDDENNTGCGFVVFKGTNLLVPLIKIAFHLPKHVSVYQAELIAIREALSLCISKWSTSRTVCFHIDSKSAIITSAAPTSKTSPLSFENYELILRSPFMVRLCHIPAHNGFHGNEIADQLAKAGAANSSSADFVVVNLDDIDISIGVVKHVLKS